ncbi:antirestriction protein ArdC [Litoreibacter ponti]|uniref:Antirestriction protein ArdC n=1 Tax=Litoreibacter ponti TaxID=1510457 RepID=A0A2T6BLA5_9RHOB|nr:zincin-like metallopeptidase domain-containing protein [Litoreibacter ponti]PTX56848.1 antirestriction protein ArdC [Litoreibacter ponti]
MAPKFDVYAHVTDTIIAEIEAGTPPWRKPWTGSASGIALPTRHNGEEYRGINVLMLWVMAAKQGHVSSRWMTYKQAQELGGQVRKGEMSSTVVKYGTFTRENELGIEEELPYARAYRVFNADQIKGLPEEYYIRPEAPRDLGTAEDPELEAFFSRTGAEIVTSDDPRAYFSPAKDHIHMPKIATFDSATGYYGTLAHEVIHWTGSEKRLERIKKFANREAYAFEELVAEIGACFLGAQIGVAQEFDQSAAYVEGWLKALKEDKRAIFRAASGAQKAADFVLAAAGQSKEVAA